LDLLEAVVKLGWYPNSTRLAGSVIGLQMDSLALILHMYGMALLFIGHVNLLRNFKPFESESAGSCMREDIHVCTNEPRT
jgi:hypothetical protein